MRLWRLKLEARPVIGSSSYHHLDYGSPQLQAHTQLLAANAMNNMTLNMAYKPGNANVAANAANPGCLGIPGSGSAGPASVGKGKGKGEIPKFGKDPNKKKRVKLSWDYDRVSGFIGSRLYCCSFFVSSLYAQQTKGNDS